MKNVLEKNSRWMDHSENFDLILEEFRSAVSGSRDLICEVGVNRGGSMKSFMDALPTDQKNWFISIDPFGSIGYHNGAYYTDISVYSNKRYRESMKLLYTHADEYNFNYLHLKMTSEDFIDCFEHLRVYDQCSQKLDKFCFVFLDGSHDLKIVEKEIDFFLNYLTVNGRIVVDDIDINIDSDFFIKLIKEWEEKNLKINFDKKIRQRTIIRFEKINEKIM
ncbi:MAG: class I SAM-dependent methyltransferase [Candidatus Parcubacteria bacterium]|nr:class I SAM-dependent methyltransferase [Candidatus Parcubacteria bacterium]